MRNPADLHTGDDWTPAITLKVDDSAYAVPSGATVRAAITDQDGINILAGPVTVLEATSGSDWGNGVIVPIFPAAQTVDLPTGYARTEVEVTHNGNVSTWSMSRTPRIEPGTITNLTLEPAPGEDLTLATLNAMVVDATLIDTTDSRLSDARTPTSHAASHATAGGDAIAPADIGAATSAQGTKADTAVQPGDAVAVPSVAVSSSKTLALSDANTEQVVDSGPAVVLTIPTNAAVALPVGSKVSSLGIGVGSVTVTASAGVTLNGVSAGSAALSAQYSAAVLTKVGTDAWVINGAHGAVS